MSSKNLPKQAFSLVIFAILFSFVNSINIPKTSAADFTIKESKIPIPAVTNGYNDLMAISENKVLYEKKVYDGQSRTELASSETYLFDLNTKKEQKIESNTPYRKTVLDIYKNKILYSCTNELYIYDTNNNSQTLITTVNEWVGRASIFGNQIVYSSSYSKPGGHDSIPGPKSLDIYLYDLTSGVNKLIVENMRVTEFDISDKYLVYSVSTYDNYVEWKNDLHLYNLKTGATTKLLSNIINMRNIGLSNDTVVWEDGRNGKYNEATYVFENTDIYYMNIATKKTGPVTANKAEQGSPSISGQNVVWADNRNGKDNADIYLYNFSTKKETRITTDPRSQSAPIIDGNKIVWSDNRSGKEEIYLAELTYPAPKPVVKPAPKPAPAPAVVKPTLTLSSISKLSDTKTSTIPIGTTPILRTDQSFAFSGTTSPNAKVTLIIQSDPITTEVTADRDGKWSYLLNPKTLNLSPGSHSITAYATDSAGVKGDSVELTKFTLKTPIQPPKPLTTEPYNYFNPFNLVSALLILAALAFLILRIIKKRKLNIQPVINQEEGQ